MLPGTPFASGFSQLSPVQTVQPSSLCTLYSLFLADYHGDAGRGAVAHPGRTTTMNKTTQATIFMATLVKLLATLEPPGRANRKLSDLLERLAPGERGD
jgi:hypothetical protein